MPSVLIPKYSLDTIQRNFFNRSQADTLNTFISNNYTDVNASIAAANPQLSSKLTISNSFINSIMADYGNGPVSKGLTALTLINTNVVTQSLNKSDIFGNFITYGYDIDFSKVSIQTGRSIIIKNLNMFDILNIAPSELVNDYLTTIDLIYHDLKQGTFDILQYQTTILRKSRIIAQTVSKVINNGTNI